jgi:cytochrome c-type biogenesis protein CcmH
MRTNPEGRKARLSASLVLALTLSALLILGMPRQVASAQTSTPSDDEVNRIAHQLYCPVCENTPLDVCPTEACRQWRDLIRQQLSEGWSEARIKQYFQDQYGDRVLAQPPASGLNWLVYVLPPIIILAGALFLFRALRTWTKSSEKGGAPQAEAGAKRPRKASASDEYVARLEEELKRRK